MTPRQFVAVTAISIGILVLSKLIFEYIRYRSWDKLEDEVDDWRDSPSGRFHGYLDGLYDSP